MAPRLSAQPGLRLLSYLALLPASAVELDAAVSRAVDENPFLERRPWRSCRTCGLATAADRCAACSTPSWGLEPVADEDWRVGLGRDAQAGLPRSLDALVVQVVATLDDHGLLRDQPDGDEESVRTVVEALRANGPSGIAASSPTDCVRVQARELAAAGAAPAMLVAI